MLAPKFKIRQLTIPVTAALVRIGYITSMVVPAMLGLVKNLSGTSPRVSKIPADRLVGFLEKKIHKLIMKKVLSALPNPRLPDVNIDVAEKHHYTQKGWEVVVRVEMGYFYVLYLEPLEALKKTNRPLYKVVRELLGIVMDSGRCPGMGAPEIIEWMAMDEYAEEEDNFEDAESTKDMQDSLRAVQKKYDRYLFGKKTPREGRSRALRSAHRRIKRISKTVPAETTAVLKNLLRLACLCCLEFKLRTVEPDVNYSYEVNPIYNSFAMLWDEDEVLSDSFMQYMNDQWGNYGAATVLLPVTDSTDIRHICLTLRTFALFQKVWYSFYDLISTGNKENDNGSSY